MRSYYVYILTNQARGTLYIGMTNDLPYRVSQHRSKKIPGYTQKWRVHRLVYFEEGPDVVAVIAREKQLKNWHRQWKINLIESVNPRWDDLNPSP